MKHLKIIVLVICAIFLTACGAKKSNMLKNTTWKTNDDSQLVFKGKDFYWYKSADDHKDNYYKGTYKLYIGKDATKYLTNDLKEYGVTKEELEMLYKNSSNKYYKEENLVVIDAKYTKYLLDGKKQKIKNPKVPMFGFINDEKDYLDVANMVTGSYYGFTKVK